MYVSPQKAAKHYRVSKETLRLWAISGKIGSVTTTGGHHRYQIIPINESNAIREKIIYARVSSTKQKEDLKRQIKFVKQEFPDYKVIKDIGSGFNFERRGFISLLERVLRGNVQEIAIAHADRLTRIGFSFIQFICQHFNTQLTVLSDKDDKEPSAEFNEEFISVISYYTAKFYGMRKYQIL